MAQVFSPGVHPGESDSQYKKLRRSAGNLRISSNLYPSKTMAGTFTSLHYHLVFSTKNREPTIHADIQARLHEYLGGIIRSESDKKGALLSAGGMPDHLHLLVCWPANRTVSDLMRIAKSKSSGWIHDTFPERASFAWQEGYGAFTVSKSDVNSVRRYIENQAEHHAHRDFKSEFRQFLERHEIDYDENTIWL